VTTTLTPLTPVLSAFWDAALLDARDIRAARRVCRPAQGPRMPAADVLARQGLRHPGSWWRRLPRGHEVVVHVSARRRSALPRGQRRRVRAGHLQGHPAHDGQPARPHRGAAISQYAMGSDHAFIYLRGEVVHVYRRLLNAVEEATAAGYLGTTSSVRASPCGSRRTRAPAPTSVVKRPRCWTPSRAAAVSRGSSPRSPVRLVSTPARRRSTTSRPSPRSPGSSCDGSDWFKSMGTEKSTGFGIFSLSGHVTNPGQFEAPLGITMRELIDLAGGIRNGHQAEVLDPGWVLDPDLHRGAPRHPARLRLGRGGGLDARHPRPAGLRRDRLGRPRGVALDRLLRPRVLRQVHPMPRGHLVAASRSWSASSTARVCPATSRSSTTSATTSWAGPSAPSAMPRPARSRRRSSTSARSSRPACTPPPPTLFPPAASVLFDAKEAATGMTVPTICRRAGAQLPPPER
jgi:hypothetical protein